MIGMGRLSYSNLFTKIVFVLIIFLLSIQPVFSVSSNINKDDFLLGLYISAQIEQKNTVLKDHKDWPRVKKIATRLMSCTNGTLYSFQIIKAPVANAFALPGGFVFITDKLLDLNLSDAELAFLIGHEITHVSRKHFSRMMKEQTKVSVVNAIAMVGAVLLTQLTKNNNDRIVNQGAYGKAGAPELSNSENGGLPAHLIPILAGNIFGTMYLLHSKRDYEFEADLHGAKLAMQAGYDFKDGLGMLKKLFYSNYRDIRYEKWQSHPLTNKRTQTLEFKLGEAKSVQKKSDGWLETYREDYCNALLKVYDELLLWKKPSMLKESIKFDRLRKILLDRIEQFNDNEMIGRSVLRKNISNHLIPKIHKQSFLRADYGLLYNEMVELKSKGGVIDENELKKISTKKEQSMIIHLKNMDSKSPGYHQYAFMIRNFPNHKNINLWKWEKWKKEGDQKIKINDASEIAKLQVKTNYIEELTKLERSVEKEPLLYVKIKNLQNKEIELNVFEKQINECESLKTLAEFQHEFPDHSMINMILKKKTELIQKKYESGKLAVFSNQYYDAVKSYHDILLYGRGSDLEEEAKRQIFKLNTMNRNK